jgi:hypothetical protein
MDQHELQRRLLLVLHRGLVEARLLAQAQRHQDIFELVDALELIPSYIDKWEADYLESVRSSLRNYRERYPNPSFDYVRYLDIDPEPGRF